MGSMRSSDAYKLELQPDSQERKAGTSLDMDDDDEYYDEENDNKDSPEDNSPDLDQADETQEVN